MGNKGSNTTTQNAFGTTASAPNAEAMDAYQRIMAKASQAADTPYQGYSGEEVAPNNAQQNAGIGTINQATRRIGAAGAPLSADDINRYMNPYTNDVVNATQADFDVQNQRANSTVMGNAAAQGALGGDRVGVAQALTQESQNRAQAPIIAGLRSSAYNSGLGAAEHEQQYGLNSAQALMGAGQGQVGAGTLEQQTQQAADTQRRQDYYQQQGYPFQVAQWMAGMDTAVGSQMGGTSTNSTQGQTQGPTPNTFAQIAGLGLSAASMIPFARGGAVSGFAGGGMTAPFASDAQSWVPQMGLTAGHGAPSPPQVHAPEAPKDQSMSPEQIMKGVGGLGKAFGNSKYGDATSDYAQDLADGDAGSFSTYFARGGGVKRYASGGSPGGGLPWLDDASAGWYAPDLIPTVAGFGASTPAVQSRSEEPADIPGEFRLDEQAHRDWQGRVDRDTGRARTNAAIQQGEPPPDLKPRPVGEVMLAQNDNGRTDPGLGPRGNPRPLSAQEDMANAIHEDTGSAGDGSALGYGEEPRRGLGAPRPSPTPPAPDQQQPEGGGGILGGLGIHLTPELRQGLLMAGLSMMSTRRGGPGSFLGALGEGGISGVASYEKTLESARQAEIQQRKEDFERLKFQRPYEEMTAKEQYDADHKGDWTEPQKAANKRAEEEWKFKRQTSPYKLNPDGTVSSNDPVIDVTQKMAEAKRGPGMSDEALDTMVPAYRAGDRSVLQQVGKGTQGAQNLNRFWDKLAAAMKDENASGEDLAVARATYMAQTAALKSSAVRESNVQSSVNEAEKTFPLLEEASKNLPRTNWPKLNAAIGWARTNAGSPEQNAYGAAIQAAITAYSQAMSRNGGNSVNAQQHAEALFDKSAGHEAIMATVGQLRKEMIAARDAPRETRKQIIDEMLKRNTIEPQSAPAGGTGEAKPVKAATPAKTLVRTGTQNSTGKTIFEYSDGTREVK